ncbi:SIGMA FACTOR BINDING PROTEIN 1 CHLOROPLASTIC [Salix purpurea]|uniref:SIGMA FACTOR BINDING PROTEIN 1 CHLOROPLASTIC n=1 Tax=Salix purpurea TaxID=77065 RepID=A0A9Q0YWZ6_SALPP|nr:SIGMA FACTOR BINDING PROTEIN 1 CHLOROPLASTIC [Salix purpurea]
MDALGVHMKSGKRLHTKRSKKPIKVVYISSPMKVNTSASEFRALVQELTGKDSDATRFMDNDGAETHHQRAGHDHRVSAVPSANSYQSPSTTSSELSFLESFDGELFPSIEESSFMGMLQSSLFHESFQLDVLD